MRDRDYMHLAEIAAQDSNCLRRKVGAVIVLDGIVTGAGNNFSPVNCHQCKDVGCIIDALNEGDAVRGGICYVTHQPCVICAKLLINAGITAIVYKESYPDELAIKLLSEAGVELIHYKE